MSGVAVLTRIVFCRDADGSGLLDFDSGGRRCIDLLQFKDVRIVGKIRGKFYRAHKRHVYRNRAAFWWILYPKRFVELAETPATFAGIALSLILVCAGFFFMAGKSVGRKEISYMAPAVIAVAAMMIIRKEIMADAEFFSAMVYYCTCAILFSGISNLTLYALKRGNISALFNAAANGKKLTAGIIMSLASSVTIFAGNISVLYAPNPAYVNALTLTAPLWVITGCSAKKSAYRLSPRPS